jgi:cytochrome P450
MWEIVAESSVMLNAGMNTSISRLNRSLPSVYLTVISTGNDTTQTTLTNNIILLSVDPEIQPNSGPS